MPTYCYNPTPQQRLLGAIDYAILATASGYVAWSKTREAPPRPDYAAAYADMRDMVAADGFKRLHRISYIA